MNLSYLIENRFRYYVLALAGVALATWVRYQLGSVLGGTIPVVIFTVPVTLAALYGGFGPGIFATVCSAAISLYLFIEPLYNFSIDGPSAAVVVLVFLIIGSMISFFGQKVKTLQASLADQARRLDQANRELAENSQRKDEFLAMLAHELRNPLAGISTAAELLKFVRLDQQRITHTSDVIGRQVRHMTQLVDDLLDVSRVTRGLVLIDKKPVDLKEAVHAAVEQVRSALEGKQQLLTVTMPAEHACVCGDRVRLTQVIGNILGNANRYSPEGSSIHIQLSLSDKEVELSIEDTGQGIEAALLPKIFDLFVQAARTPDRSQGGLGIGLALVKKIIELHEGQVTAHSEGLNQGSRFTIILPRFHQRAEKATPHLKPAKLPIHMQTLNILVVDDNQDAADTLALLLEASGHSVFVEYGPKGALDRAHHEDLDAVILDIGLPEMDGHELCRRMKMIPHLTNAVFIALSGYGQDKDQKQSEAAGFDHHLIKPVDLKKLMGALSSRKIM